MTNSKDTFTFNGFEPANTTPVPDVLFDVLLPYLNEAQLKVMLYIIRRTLGFKKTSDAISLNQFRWGITTKDGKKLDDGCGLKNFTTISKALKELEQMNCIESDKRETDEGNNLTTVYRIRFRGTTQNVVGTTDSVVGVLRKTYDRTTSSGGRVLRKTEPQETVLQQTDKQDTELQEREIPPNTLDTHTSVSSDTARAASSQDEQVFTNDEPQGDAHATLPASGHPHRVGDAAAPGGDSGHTPVDDRPLATSEIRPVLEAQEIDEKGQIDGNQPCTSRSHPDGSRQHMRVSGNSGSRDLGTPYQEALTETPPTSTPAQSLSSPQAEQAASGATRTRTRKEAAPKPETPKSPPVEPPADMAWGTRKCLLWFDFWRGGILIGKWKLMQASTCAKGLAEQFDEQTVIQARTDMEADPYYAAKGGCDVCDVANNIHKYLKRRERQHLQLVAAIPTSKPLPRIATKEELRRIPV